MKAKAIAINAKPANLTDGNGGNVGVVAKGFPLMNVAEMHLDCGKTHSGDRISDGNTGMGQGTRVN